MKITYLQVQDKRFSLALSKLATYGGFTDYKSVANIKALLKQFEKISSQAQKEWITLLKDFALLDDKKEFIFRKVFDSTTGQTVTQPGTFTLLPGKEEEFEKATIEFNAKEKEVWADPIPFASVSQCQLSAADLIQLEDFISEPETEKPALEVVK